MTASILAILAGVTTLVIFFVKRRATPAKQLELALDENDTAIDRGDVDLLLDSRLRHTSPNHSIGQDSITNESGATVHAKD